MKLPWKQPQLDAGKSKDAIFTTLFTMVLKAWLSPLEKRTKWQMQYTKREAIIMFCRCSDGIPGIWKDPLKNVLEPIGEIIKVTVYKIDIKKPKVFLQSNRNQLKIKYPIHNSNKTNIMYMYIFLIRCVHDPYKSKYKKIREK